MVDKRSGVYWYTDVAVRARAESARVCVRHLGCPAAGDLRAFDVM